MIARRHSQGAVKHLPVYGKEPLELTAPLPWWTGNGSRYAAPNLFSFHLQTYAKCGLHLAQGPFDPHSVGHAHVHSWTSLRHIGSNFQINNIYIYIHTYTYSIYIYMWCLLVSTERGIEAVYPTWGLKHKTSTIHQWLVHFSGQSDDHIFWDMYHVTKDGKKSQKRCGTLLLEWSVVQAT